MSFTAVILKLPFSALSTVRWERGGEMLQERASGRSQPHSLPVSISQGDAREALRALGSLLPLTPTIPRSSGLGGADLRRVKAPGRRGGVLGQRPPRAALRTSGGEVPQLFPANCFTYVLEKDMALSFRNHSSAQWVQQGANTCETPTEAAPSPFLKHLFVCIQGNRLQAYLIQFSLCTIHI